jgi:hypothetical protein
MYGHLKIEVTPVKFAIRSAVLLLFLGTTTSVLSQRDEEGSEGAKPAEQATPAARPAQQRAHYFMFDRI